MNNRIKWLSGIILCAAVLTVGAFRADAREHIVRPGDTLYRIAREHATTWPRLAEYNALADPHLIFPGQRIRLPAFGSVEAPEAGPVVGPAYTSEEVTVGGGTPWPLGGTLTVPVGASAQNPVPAVVLVHGSGPTDRDLAIGVAQNRAFYDIATYLSSQGIAVLRYDKRTYVHGAALAAAYGPAFTVQQETIQDAVRAADLLRADPRIDRVYVAGISLGGMLAPRIHAEGGDFAGLILLAGSPRPLLEITVDQERDLMALQMRYFEDVEGLLRAQRDTLLAAMQQVEPIRDLMPEEWQQLQAALDEVDVLLTLPEETLRGIFMAQFDELYALQEALLAQMRATVDMTPEAAQGQTIGAWPAYYIRDMMLNPAPSLLAQTEVPMLILQGANDFQVFADVDFAMFRELLGDRDNVTFRLYEGLGHLFMPCAATNPTDALWERDNTPARVDARVLRDMAEWILG